MRFRYRIAVFQKALKMKLESFRNQLLHLFKRLPGSGKARKVRRVRSPSTSALFINNEILSHFRNPACLKML